MLGLLHSTDPRWVQNAETDVGRLLSDHAHCELKAAQNALSLVARWGGEFPAIVEPLGALAKEETEHFERVHHELVSRGFVFQAPAADPYVVALRARPAALARSGAIESSEPLLDRLLVAALIEARSCERFRLLSQNASDRTLADMYHDLMASEARHYRLFVDLAERIFGGEAVTDRLAALSASEATIASELPLEATVHG
jgi:tRNA 2-(methylsulfanyl)-N6-isopentenyladenosine37 hydroxylase